MDKILIIKSNFDLFLSKYDSIEKYYKCSISNKLLRLFKKFNLPLNIFLGKWKKKIKEYNTIILFDNGYSDYVSKYIKKKNPKSKIIFWYWNALSEYNNKLVCNKYIDEIWSYSKFDCERFNLKYNTQFFSKKVKSDESIISCDALFMGSNKGRKENLEILKNDLEKFNVKTDFRIIENSKDYISYNEYLKLVFKSKCIVDYCSNPKEFGISLRVMESLFLEKKLITNNLNVKNFDFYNSKNIFIIGIDNLERIVDFLKSPYEKIDRQIIEYYDYENWLKRFDEK